MAFNCNMVARSRERLGRQKSGKLKLYSKITNDLEISVLAAEYKKGLNTVTQSLSREIT